MTLNLLQKPNQKEADDGIQYALQILKQLPKNSDAELEAHVNGMLIVFWAALWGTYGIDYAKGFIESQLKGMNAATQHEPTTSPNVH